MLIIVCDDDSIHLNHTIGCLSANPLLSGAIVKPYTDPSEMLIHVGQGATKPDIAILDIAMPQNGIAIARQINEYYPRCQIIFLTGHLDYATEVYDVNHTYFLLKRDFETRIDGALKKAIRRLDDMRELQLAFSFNGAQTILPAQEALYLERSGHRTIIHCMDCEHVTYTHPEACLGDALPLFVRCHHSYYVNLRHIRAVEKNRIVLQSGASVPVSRARARQLRRALLAGWPVDGT